MNKKEDLYKASINRVIDFIDKNLDQEMTLGQLSRVANFSEFHFHRIFRAYIGEPLNKYIQRIRIEKAATLLLTDQKKTITQIAFDCGFSSSQFFARVFKQYFNQNASDWRKERIEKSKIVQSESKNVHCNSKIVKESNNDLDYISSILKTKEKSMKDLKVDVKTFEDMHTAYLRYIGPYKGDEELFGKLFEKLFTWAGARNLLNFPETKVLSLYYDDPNITDDSKLRVTVCVTVPENTPVDGEIGYLTIEGGQYAVAHFELDTDQYEEAWNSVFKEWFPKSGFQPDDKPSFELMLNDPHEHPEGKHIVDICIPVKPL